MIIFEFMDLSNLGKNNLLSDDELKDILETVKENIYEMLRRNGLGKMVLPSLQGLENPTTFGKRFNITAQRVNKILLENNLIRKNEKKEYELTEDGKDIGFVTVTQVVKASKEKTKKITIDCTFPVMIKVEFEEQFRKLLEQSKMKE